MTNYFTPNENQNLKKQKTQKRSLKHNSVPSGFALKVIFGYSAGLQIVKSKHIGNFEILNN